MNFENIIAVGRNKTIYRDGNRCIKLFDVKGCFPKRSN